MKKIYLIFLGALFFVCLLLATSKTPDGDLITPQGQGTVTLDSGTFEAFPLPDYAAKFVSEDYKSYLVEVEPGIKIHVLEVGRLPDFFTTRQPHQWFFIPQDCRATAHRSSTRDHAHPCGLGLFQQDSC